MPEDDAATGSETDPDEADSGSEEAELDPTLKREFVAQVLLLNVSLLAIALGAMVFYFRGRIELGIALLAIGLVAGLATLRRYRARAPS